MGRKLLKTVQTITTFRTFRRGPPLVRGPQFENRWFRCGVQYSSCAANRPLVRHGMAIA